MQQKRLQNPTPQVIYDRRLILGKVFEPSEVIASSLSYQ